MPKNASIDFTDLNDKSIFTLHPHEFPESISDDRRVTLNKIQYPDDHYSNQIIGVHPGEVRLRGIFSGSYVKDGAVISAKVRSDDFVKALKKVIKVIFAINGEGSGSKNTFIVEEYNRNIVDYYHVEYEILLVPHQPQTRVTPSKVSLTSIGNDSDAASLVGSVTNRVTRHVGGQQQATTVKPGVSKPKLQTPVAKEIAKKPAPIQPKPSQDPEVVARQAIKTAKEAEAKRLAEAAARARAITKKTGK